MTLNEIAALLESLPAFSKLPFSAIRALAQVAEVRAMAADEVLWAEGDPSTCLGYVVAGKVRRIKTPTHPEGAQDVTASVQMRVKSIRFAEKGALVGFEVLDGYPRLASLVAATPVRMLIFTQAALDELETKQPGVALHFHKILSRHITLNFRRMLGMTVSFLPSLEDQVSD